jgi:hypothetical protein
VLCGEGAHHSSGGMVRQRRHAVKLHHLCIVCACIASALAVAAQQNHAFEKRRQVFHETWRRHSAGASKPQEKVCSGKV